MFKGGRGDIVEKAGEGLFFVVGKTPDDEGDADAVGEDGIEVLEIVETIIVHRGHADAA